MCVMDHLIYDRTRADVDVINELYAKGWEDMIPEERAFWLRGSETALYCLDGRVECLDGPLNCRDMIIRGSYNTTDLNRVGAAAEYLTERFHTYGYLVDAVPRTGWQIGDIPTWSQMERYRKNIVSLRGAIAVLATTPPTPESMRFLDWAGANNMEKILADLDVLLTSMAKVFPRAGTPWAMAGVEIYIAN